MLALFANHISKAQEAKPQVWDEPFIKAVTSACKEGEQIHYTFFDTERSKAFDLWNGYLNPDIDSLPFIHWFEFVQEFGEEKGYNNENSMLKMYGKFANDRSYHHRSFLSVVHNEYEEFNMEAYERGDISILDGQFFPKYGIPVFTTKKIFSAVILGRSNEGILELNEEFIFGNLGLKNHEIFVFTQQGDTLKLTLGEKIKIPYLEHDTAILRIELRPIDASKGGGVNPFLRINYIRDGGLTIKCSDIDPGTYKAPDYRGDEFIPQPDSDTTWLNMIADIPYDYKQKAADYFVNVRGRPHQNLSWWQRHEKGWVTQELLPGNFGKADVTVVLAEGHTQLTKPLIMLDGFDYYGEWQKILVPATGDDVHYSTGYHRRMPDYSAASIREYDINYQDRRHDELWCELCQPGVGYGQNVKDYIRENCYDIVLVNWHGGADFYQKNAMVLIKILQRINEEKAVDTNGFKHPNVIVGPSMGGVIARYALLYMEAHEAVTGAHDVSHFYSDDSPQYGANVPLGVQYALAHICAAVTSNGLTASRIPIGDVEDFFLRFSAVSSPAALQGLNYHIFGSPFRVDNQGTSRICPNFESYANSHFELSDGTIGTQIAGSYPSKHLSTRPGSHYLYELLQWEYQQLGLWPKRCQILGIGNGAGNASHQVNNQPYQANDNTTMNPEDIIFSARDGEVKAYALPMDGVQKVISDCDLPATLHQVVKADGMGNHAIDNAAGGVVTMLSVLNKPDEGQNLYTPNFCHEFLISTLGMDPEWARANGQYYTNFCEMTPQQYMPYSGFDKTFFLCNENTKHCSLRQPFLDFVDNSLRHVYFQNRQINTGRVSLHAKEDIIMGQNVVDYKPQGAVYFSGNAASGGVQLSAGDGIVMRSGVTIAASSNTRAFIKSNAHEICDNPITPRLANPAPTTLPQTPKPTQDPSIETIGQVNIYPNPNNGNFTLESPIEQGKLMVFNALGAPVHTQILPSKQANVTLHGLPPGIYLVRLESPNGQFFTQKLILE